MALSIVPSIVQHTDMLALLLHRWSMLLVDRVAGMSCVGIGMSIRRHIALIVIVVVVTVMHRGTCCGTSSSCCTSKLLSSAVYPGNISSCKLMSSYIAALPASALVVAPHAVPVAASVAAPDRETAFRLQPTPGEMSPSSTTSTPSLSS